MPISAYYGGHGDEVMAEMMRKHGAEAGKREFYATANKRKQKPKGKNHRRPGMLGLIKE